MNKFYHRRLRRPVRTVTWDHRVLNSGARGCEDIGTPSHGGLLRHRTLWALGDSNLFHGYAQGARLQIIIEGVANS